MKILKLLEQLIKELHSISDSQNKLTNKMNEINENIKGGIGHLRFDDSGISIVSKFDNLENSISKCVKEYNINNKIDKEVEYLDRYKQIKKNNPKLLEFVEKYFKYDDKYQVLDLVEEVRVLYGLGNEINLNGGKH